MKKKLMAMLVAAAMLVCMMPAMAFADEAPAEEQVVQATEEVVVPEAAEEEAVAEAVEEGNAVLENEAVVEEVELEGETATYGGYWSGYVYTFTGNEAGAADCWVEINYDRVEAYTIKVGANDFSSLVNDALKDKAMCWVNICYHGAIAESAEYILTERDFLAMKAKVVVDKAASKDTIFTYVIDSAIADKDVWDEEKKDWIECGLVLADPADVDGTLDFFGNTITLKAGQTSAEGFLNLAIGWDDEAAPTDNNDVRYSYVGFVFKEKENNGGYATDPSLWSWTYLSYEFTDDGHRYAKFANTEELQAFLDKFNELDDNRGDIAAFYDQVFSYTEMTYTHSPKGVQTGDINSLGLWVVVMAVAGVAAAAVALKRREN